ncbi:MAG: amidohydrolase family protein [Acidobacteriota bacterium]|nr:amidohydrolase family protein [Acidobacteriota bacterium]
MAEEIIDVHVHFGAPYDSESGCYWSKEFEEGIAFFAMRLVTNSYFRKPDIQSIKDHMLAVIRGSTKIDKCVLLAMDQVYDENGDVHGGNASAKKTHLHVPNSYLAKLAGENSRILLGASVHPYRRDWENEPQYCLDHHAVLCKWIPSSQQIDPMHPKCRPFYGKLAEQKLPLLCHTGPEGAIPPFDKASQRLNSPSLLREALDTGVAVIAAHAALPLLPPPLESDQYYQELMELFREAESKNWSLYADLSAISLGPRNGYIDRIKEAVAPQRLIYGSDYPIPMLDISQKPHLSLWHWLEHFFQTISVKNPLDKNYFLVKNMEFDESLFCNALKVLRLD